MGCERCETLPDPTPERATLYLVPPMHVVVRTVVERAEARELIVDVLDGGIVTVSGDRETLDDYVTDLSGILNAQEENDTKALLVEEGRTVSISDLVRMGTLQAVTSRLHGSWLSDLLREERLTTYFQPIVHGDRPDTVYGFECLSRGLNRDGSIIPPHQLFGTARKAEMLFFLDRMARIFAVRTAAAREISEKIFVNFIPTTIYRPEHCLRTTMSAIEDAGISPEQIVFELVESDRVDDVNHLKTILDFYRDQGFFVALDDVGSGHNSLLLMADTHPQIVKIDAGLVRFVHQNPFRARIVRNIVEMSKDMGILVLAEGVERREEFEWLQDVGVDLAQGYLFGKPKPVPERRLF